MFKRLLLTLGFLIGLSSISLGTPTVYEPINLKTPINLYGEYDVAIPPELSTITIGADGDAWTFVYSESVNADTIGELCSDYSVTMSKAGVETLSYTSGTGTATVVCAGSTTVESGETVLSGLDYTPGTIVNSSSTALASISSKSVTNNSTYTSLLLAETLEASPFDNPACGIAPCYTTAGTIDGDYSTIGLDMIGTYCLRLDAGGYATLFHDAQDQTSVYYLFKWRYEDTIDATEALVNARTTTNSSLAGVYVYANGDIKAVAYGGAFSIAAGTNHTVDTSLWIKFKATEGTGANSEGCVSTWNGSSWDSYVCNTAGTTTGDINRLEVMNNQDETGVEYNYADNIKISLSDFTADPNTY